MLRPQQNVHKQAPKTLGPTQGSFVGTEAERRVGYNIVKCTGPQLCRGEDGSLVAKGEGEKRDKTTRKSLRMMVPGAGLEPALPLPGKGF
jgi:hypothetical protein